MIYNMFFKGVLGTRFRSIELKIRFLESANIIIRSLESEKSGPYQIHNIFPKKRDL